VNVAIFLQDTKSEISAFVYRKTHCLVIWKALCRPKHTFYGGSLVPARFLADRTIRRAIGTVSRLSVVCLSSVCNVLYCGKTVRPSEKVSEGVNRKPGSKSTFFGSPPYFYFRFRRYGPLDGRFFALCIVAKRYVLAKKCLKE